MITNELDERIRAAVGEVADSAPEPTPFGEVIRRTVDGAPDHGIRRRRGTTELVAGAMAVGIAVGVAVVIAVATQPDASGPAVRPSGSHLSSTTRGPLAIRVELPRATLRAGRSMTGTVVVRNRTGHPVPYTYCGSLFNITLGNEHYRQPGYWTQCATPGTLPTGNSTFRVDVVASKSLCTNTPQPSVPTCRPNGSQPPLAAGRYRAQLEYNPSNRLGALPPPITVRVVRAH